MRDVIKKMVADEIDAQRPPYRYGIVQSIDRDNFKCSVLLTGDPAPVMVNMGSIQPKETGQKVRVEGNKADKYVADVIGEPYHYDVALLGNDYGKNKPVLILGPDGDNEPSLRLVRDWDGSNKGEAYVYLSGGAADPVGVMLVRNNDIGLTRLLVRSTGQLQVQSYGTGAAVRPIPFAMETGSISISGGGSDSATAAITFTAGRFTSTPYLFATARTSANYIMASVHSSGLSTSGGTVRLTNTNEATFASAHTVQWLAIQMER